MSVKRRAVRKSGFQPPSHGLARNGPAPSAVGLFLGFLLLWAAGCGDGSTPPRAGSPAAARTTTTLVPGAAQAANAESPTAPQAVAYAYNPDSRRDPFRSILVTAETAKALEKLPPLQRTEVGDLRLIGVVWGGFGYSAMIQTPEGKGYTVRVGTLVGPNNGRVKRIAENYLTVEEKYTDIFGEKKTRELKMDLHPQKEGSE